MKRNAMLAERRRCAAVKVFFSIKSDYRIPPEIVDLSKPYCRDKIASHESPEKWGIEDVQELWSGVAS